MTIRCITFDLDNTLWAIEPVIQRAEIKFYAWLEQHCPCVTRRYSLQELTDQRRAYFREYPQLRHNLTELRKQWLEKLFAEHACPALDVDAAFKFYWRHRNEVELFEGVLEVLEGLGRRYRIGAITNGNACVETIGIGRYFEFVISSERIGVAKPAAGIFQAALQAAQVPASQVAHIGDDPGTDILGAGAAGLRTIWYNPALDPWPGGQNPDAVIRSLAQLQDTLESL